MSEKPEDKKYPPTLCWDCEKAIGDCRWSSKLRPIKGWKIIKTQKKIHGGGEYESCIVLECPEFKADAYGSGLKRLSDPTTYETMMNNLKKK